MRPIKSLLDEPRYKGFKTDRDKALERIHSHCQTDMSRILHSGLEQIENLSAAVALRSNGSMLLVHTLSRQFQEGVDAIFTHIFPQLVFRAQNMRKAVYTLTYTSELEAIGRATQRPLNVHRHDFKKKLNKSVLAPTFMDQGLDKRVWLNLMKLRNKLLDAFNIGLVIQDATVAKPFNPREIVERVKDVFPEIKRYKKPQPVLKRVREADRNPGDTSKRDVYDYDFVDDSDWELAVSAYKDTELQPTRFDDEPTYDPSSGNYKYSWELEQEMTEDFVEQVRAGQIDAANDLGIQDFVWIAIIDDRTDDCCLDRNGHTSQEIQEMLDSGKLDATVCDAITSPAHPKCRCDNGPVADVKPVEGPDWNSFNEWLEAA